MKRKPVRPDWRKMPAKRMIPGMSSSQLFLKRLCIAAGKSEEDFRRMGKQIVDGLTGGFITVGATFNAIRGRQISDLNSPKLGKSTEIYAHTEIDLYAVSLQRV